MDLFVKTLGTSGPLVLFESGLAATHLSWMGIAPRVAEFARVLLYDRAGYGYSQEGAAPRLASQCGREVPLTEAAVVVGHSFGALIARLVAVMRPELVAGLVLLDPIILGEFQPPTPASRARLRRGCRVASLLTWAARLKLIGPGIALAQRWRPLWSDSAQQLFQELSRLPPETWPVIRKHWTKPQSFRTIRRYFESLEESCREGLEWTSLGELPLTVISGAHRTAAERAEHERTAQLSSKGRHLVAPSGRHWVHLDEPDLVVEVIREHCQLVARSHPQEPSPSLS